MIIKLLLFRYIHLGPKITSLLYGNHVNPENSSRLNIRNLISVGPETVFILCGNSLQNSGIRPDRIPPDSIIIHYGFQVRQYAIKKILIVNFSTVMTFTQLYPLFITLQLSLKKKRRVLQKCQKVFSHFFYF